MNNVKRLMSPSSTYTTISLDIRVGVNDRGVVDIFLFKDMSGNIVLPQNAVIGNTYKLYSSTDHLINEMCIGAPLGGGLKYFYGEYDSVTNNESPTAFNFVSREFMSLQGRQSHTYDAKPFVLQHGISYMYLYRSFGPSEAEQLVLDPLTCYMRVKISSPKLRKTKTVIEYVNPINSGIQREFIDTVFMYRNSSGSLMLPENAIVGHTYSLFSETSHAARNVWNDCPAKVVMIFGVYDPVSNPNFVVMVDPPEIPDIIQYPVDFVLQYGISDLYLYGTNLDGSLKDPSTYFAYFKMTTTQS